MATRYYSFVENEYYHIYNRGNSKQEIFRSDNDYSRFKATLYLANSTEPFVLRDIEEEDIFVTMRDEPLVHIGTYCLMPNHFHLLITPAKEKGVSVFMNKLGTSYSAYFNRKYDRTGSLFEGSYKAKFIESDRYLKYLFAYIHLNPFRSDRMHGSGVSKSTLSQYPHSSLPDYLGQHRAEKGIINPERFPQYFTTASSRAAELFEWLDYSEK